MDVNPKQTHRHSAAFKVQVLAACAEPCTSVAAVALSFGLNDNLVHPMASRPGGEYRAISSKYHRRACAGDCRVVLACAAGAAGGSGAIARGGHYRDDPTRVQARGPRRHGCVAGLGAGRLRSMPARVVAMVRIDALWIRTQPLDMRAGAERQMAHVVHALGSARAHHGYLFANAGATRIKLLVHDGLGVWCAARRLNAGRFVSPVESSAAAPLPLTQARLDALVGDCPGSACQR